MKSSSIQSALSTDASKHHRVLVPLVLGALALLAGAYVWDDAQSVLEKRDRFVLDQFHANSHKVPAQKDVVILGIDDSSQRLDTLWEDEIAASPALVGMQKAYPWPRRVWAHVLDRLFESGARFVFLDLTFKGPAHDPEDDRLLHEALQRHRGKVVIGGKYEFEAMGNETAVRSTENVRLILPTSSVVGEEFTASDMFGLLNFFSWDPYDATVRHASYLISANQISSGFDDPTEKHQPSIAMVLARKTSPEAAGRTQPIERIRFGGDKSYPPVSIHQMFVPDLWANNFENGAIFKDKIVMIGATASDLQDFQETTIGRMAGVQLHAHAYAALVTGSFIHDAPTWWKWGSLLLGGFLAWVFTAFAKHPLASLGALLLLTIGAYGGCYLLFDRFNMEASPLPFVLALDFCGIAGATGNYLMQRRERQRALRLLARYTSPDMAREMIRDRASLFNALGGTERTVTVLFSDVRGFTSMSENMTPAQIVGQLNEYLSKMVERVFLQRGLVDKFIGDAVMALWGSMRGAQNAEDDREDARRAVRSALEMRQSLEDLNTSWRSRGIEELKFGIGIHQGPVIVGNIGSESPFEKMDITVIGDSVNTASRLEGATKQYGVDLLISDTVRKNLDESFVCRSADLVRVKGKLKPLEVFAVVGSRDQGVPAGLETFELGVRQYRAGDFTHARESFQQAASAGLDDYLTTEYLQRCDQLLAEPPQNWDGVYVMTKK